LHDPLTINPAYHYQNSTDRRRAFELARLPEGWRVKLLDGAGHEICRAFFGGQDEDYCHAWSMGQEWICDPLWEGSK
jgi:hypothetical protein